MSSTSFAGIRSLSGNSSNNATAAPSSSSIDQASPRSVMQDPSSENMVIVGILIGFIIFLCMVLAWVALPPILGYIRKKMPVSQKRINRRYDTIDGWLITKRVQPHDECCNILLSELTEEPQKYCQPCKGGEAASFVDDSISTDDENTCEKSTTPCICKKQKKMNGKRYSFTPAALLQKLASIHWDKEDLDILNSTQKGDDENDDCQFDQQAEDAENLDEEHSDDEDEDSFNKSCGICLEKFRVGEAVSWSCDPDCEHVFHHECLRSWLLRRVRCPFCRTIVLPVDKPPRQEDGSVEKRSMFSGDKFSSEELHQMAGQRAGYLTQTYFCVEEGLVILRSLEKDEPSTPSPSKNTKRNSKSIASKEKSSMDKSASSNEAGSTSRLLKLQFWKRRRQNDEQLPMTQSTTTGNTANESDTTLYDENGTTSQTLRLGTGGNDETFDMDEEEGIEDLENRRDNIDNAALTSSSDDDEADYDQSESSTGCSSAEVSSKLDLSASITSEHEVVFLEV